MATHQIRVALDGIVQLLSRNLYASPDAFVRELLQNAHDSIVRRRSIEAAHVGSIAIVLDPLGQRLSFHDDGTGLTAKEIHDYLATIGRSGTKEFKRQLVAGGSLHASHFIGQFGIGLLSAFLVAQRVEVETRPRGADEAWRWTFDGGAQYELQPVQRTEVGTSVTLHLGAAHVGYLQPGRVQELVRRYADFLDVPITVGGDPRPINAMRPPWAEGRASTEASRAFFRRRFGGSEPLLTVPLSRSFDGGTVRGVLAIPDRRLDLARGSVHLYVRRMFIGAQQPGLLPAWASFVDGVVDCDELTPTAARDAVLQDDVLRGAQAAIGSVIVEALQQAATGDHDTLVGVLRFHASAVLGLCVENDRLFEALADIVPLRSSLGPASLPELLTRSGDGRVYAIDRRDGIGQIRALCAARDLPLLELAEPYAETFVRQYAERWPSRLQVVWLDDEGAAGLLTPLPAQDRLAFAPLLTRASRCSEERVDVARFAPADLPAVRLETRRGRGRREVRELVDNVGLPAFLEDALGGVAASTGPDEAVIVLNADNPLIEDLRTTAVGPRADAVLESLLDQTRLFGGVTLSEPEHLAVLCRTSAALRLALQPTHPEDPEDD